MYKIDKFYRCEDLTSVYKLDNNVEIYLAYESDYKAGIARKIYVTGRRYFTIMTAHDTEAFLIIYDPRLKTNIIESIAFNEKGNAKLAEVFDKYQIIWQEGDQDSWDDFKYWTKHYNGSSAGIYFFKQGFYIFKTRYTDFNNFKDGISVYVDNGPRKDTAVLRFFEVSGSPFAKRFRLDEDVFNFVDAALTNGIVLEEFEEFMKKQKEIYHVYEKFFEY